MTDMQILTDLAAGKITPAEAMRLQAKAKEKPITVKRGEKGGVCLCGLQRFPTTLYPGQWKRFLGDERAVADVLALCDEIEAEEAAVEAAAEAAKAAA
jgi:hypothetical protein